ncbi:hypothetical protein JI739_09165 [Ramlibacter sp. AW1]|uniref:Uncharacterized protein n=1 Tax=Ramlibacter aurantiacus TaxID=2801330 RepID=A0A936ZTV2_9BURK|nr:hypothetical protein [Ramlibacter aurantiacus]MBL0420509.1 hypothetical protein [Ramlibacter aurantiacus]
MRAPARQKSGTVVSLRPSIPGSEDAAYLAAFMVADIEHQAELAGREPELADWAPVVNACGLDAAECALRVRGWMHTAHANELRRAK